MINTTGKNEHNITGNQKIKTIRFVQCDLSSIVNLCLLEVHVGTSPVHMSDIFRINISLENLFWQL